MGTAFLLLSIWTLLVFILGYKTSEVAEKKSEKTICIYEEGKLIKQKEQEDFFNRVHGSIERNVNRQEYALKDPKNTLQGITIALQKLLKL